MLLSSLNADADLIAAGMVAREMGPRIASGGASVESRKSSINTDLALISDAAISEGGDFVILCNLGANDAGHVPFATEADWKSDYRYIIDAAIVKFPTGKIYIAKAWIRTQPANCNTMAGWIDDLVAEYAISNPDRVYVGHNEIVWLENGDDGTTYTDDGTHYNAAGHPVGAAQWFTILGY